MKQRLRYLRHLIYVILLVAADQLLKYWAKTYLAEKGPIEIIPGALELSYHTNTGAVWGIMQGHVNIFTVISVIVLVFLVIFYFKTPEGKKYTPLRIIFVFVAAGAIGNFIDRITLKHVVDFIYFSLIDFPVFNIADCYLTVSSILLIILALFYYKDKELSFMEDMVKNLVRRKKKPADDNETAGKDE